MPEFPQPIEYDALPQAAMDYSTLAVIGRVARESLVGSRLRRVVGLPGGDIILAFDRFADRDRENSPGSDACVFSDWLFSADIALYRVHPWTDPLPEKSNPSHLVQVLSHHLSGGRVDNVEVARFERVLTLQFTRREYTGEEIGYRFVSELMGKHSNLILVDADNVIVASHKPVHSYQSRLREIRPGKEYFVPPKQDRIEPREFTPAEWLDFTGSSREAEGIGDLLARTFLGMSPLWARAVCARAEVFHGKPVLELRPEESENLRLALGRTVEMVLGGIPLIRETPLQMVRRVTADFAERSEDAALDKARREVSRVIDRRRKKLKSLSEGLGQDLDQADRAGEYKKKADLLLAHIHQVTPGMDRIVLDDWETGEKVELVLDAHLSPQFQAEAWYERYRKLKRTHQVARERINAVNAEEEELRRLGEHLASASSEDEIGRIREQCVLHGLIPAVDEGAPVKGGRKGGKAGRRVGAGGPAILPAHRYRSNDGFLIMAGANDRSNDALRRSSSPEDIWLHTREIPGSHVYIITRGRQVPDSTLREAAMIAVWHSKARDGSNVPVDYTRVKYLTPIPGGPAGRVRFRRERTLRVTPDEKRIEMMRLMAGSSPSPPLSR